MTGFYVHSIKLMIMKNQREILFRGKDLDGNWIKSMSVRSYKSGIHKSGIGYKLLMKQWETIEPETLGQYTGLKDKDGVNVFDGDVVSYKGTYTYEVYFDECGFLSGIGDDAKDATPYPDTIYQRQSFFKVIGNIHDNPELIKQ